MGLWRLWTIQKGSEKSEVNDSSQDFGTWERMRPILLWLLVPAIVLHLSLGKRQFYFLPLLPPIALIAGWYCEHWLKSYPPAWIGRVAAGSGVLLVLGLVACGASIVIRPTFLQAYAWPINSYQVIFTGLVTFLVAVVSIHLWRSPDARNLLSFLFVVILGMEFLMFSIVYPVLNSQKSCRRFADLVTTLAGSQSAVVGAIGKADKSMYHVYGRYRVVPIEAEDGIYQITKETPTVIVVRKSDMIKVPDEIQRFYAPVTEMKASGDAMVVLRRIGTLADAVEPVVSEHEQASLSP
jgi:hypothetical protein